MPYGLEVINDFGSVLISSNALSMQFKAKYTATIPAGAATNRNVDISVPNCTNPIFAMRPQAAGGADRWFLLSAGTTGTTRTVRCWYMSSGGFLGANDTSSFPITLYHFDIPDTAIGGNFGLKLYDQYGACTFNSNILPVYVEGAIYESTAERPDYEDYPNLLPGYYNMTLAAGRLGAIVFNGNYWEEFSETSGGYYHHFQTVGKVSGQVVSVYPRAPTVDASPASSAISHYTGTPGGLVIDVAGF